MLSLLIVKPPSNILGSFLLMMFAIFNGLLTYFAEWVFNLKQLHLITCMDKHLRSGVLWPRARPQLTAFSHNDWTSFLASHRLGTLSQSCSFCCGLKRKFQKAQRPSSQQHNLLISVAGTLIPLTHKTHGVNNDCSVFRSPKVYLPFSLLVLENQLQDQHYKL